MHSYFLNVSTVHATYTPVTISGKKMGELIGINSLNTAVGTLERLLRDHIASMETVNEPKQPMDWRHGSLKRRQSKLHTGADALKEIKREDKVSSKRLLL